MAWTYKGDGQHSLSSDPVSIVIVDTSDTSYGANGTCKDLIATDETVETPNVTITTGGAWGNGFKTAANGGSDYYGIAYSTGPAVDYTSSGNGVTMVFFVNAYDGTNSNGYVCEFVQGSESVRFNSGDSNKPAWYVASSYRFTANTAWPTTSVAFCHALAYKANTTGKALYALETASDLADDNSTPPINAGYSTNLEGLGGLTGGGHVVADYFQIVTFDSIVSDADLQLLFDDPLLLIDTGAASITPQAMYHYSKNTGSGL